MDAHKRHALHLHRKLPRPKNVPNQDGNERKEEWELRSEAHVGVSADKLHVTYFVQHFTRGLFDHLKGRDHTFDVVDIDTDGAASQFKQRHTLESLHDSILHLRAKWVLWQTCAPGHGKGPWDGIAVIKRLLSMLERQGKCLNQTAAEVFQTLIKFYDEWTKSIRSNVQITNFFFHYIPKRGEAPMPLPNLELGSVFKAVVRPTHRPLVGPVTGIRINFCFLANLD